MADCVFCMIGNHEIPSNVVYEDDKIIAFKDLDPQGPVHVLVIPKKHIACLDDVKPEDHELMGHIMCKIGEIAKSTPIDKTVATMYTPRLYGRYLIASRTHIHIVLDDIKHVKDDSQWYPPTYLRINLYINPKTITCGIIFIIIPIMIITISVHIRLIIRSSP